MGHREAYQLASESLLKLFPKFNADQDDCYPNEAVAADGALYISFTMRPWDDELDDQFGILKVVGDVVTVHDGDMPDGEDVSEDTLAV